ncbi:MAG: aldehyde dehydrogenase [Subtercola sp.]|nr:aldehyde dehydrogenase [Subtercola sp.]
MQSRTSFYIGGDWVSPSSDTTYTMISPTTEEAIGIVPEAQNADIDRAVAAARSAFDDPTGWSTWTAEKRGEVIERFADTLQARVPEIARAISSQNGMPLQISEGFEQLFPPMLLRYYAGLATAQDPEERRSSVFGDITAVRREPIGVVAAIVPWNFPQALAFLKIAPALAAGCTIVHKPSPETTLDSYLMAEAAIEAGFPPGVLNVVQGGREVGAYLVAHPGVDKVSFTGSTAAGRSIGAVCGRLIRPVTLELGGKSAAILLDDADIAGNLESFFQATLLNNGQTCNIATRIIAPRSRYDEIVETLSSFVSALPIGDPLDPATVVGPLVSQRQFDRVEGYIAQGIAQGARLTTGGGRPHGLDRGYFIAPTIFADVDNTYTIAQEEIFGPVLSVIPYCTDDEAVRIANESPYGLGGSVWSADPERAMQVARRVQTGTIGINGYINDLHAPSGGVKSSGLGSELGPEGLSSYQQLKSIYRAP